MLVIREPQLRALRENTRAAFRSRLYWYFSTRRLPFGLPSLGREIDAGLAEAERLEIRRESDIQQFLESVFEFYGGFERRSAEGEPGYPSGAPRFLEARVVLASERVRRLAEWIRTQQSRKTR